jgi:hypothetical protein
MKELYSGYSKKTEKELKELWNDSLITFDTNVILNLYSYSESTRNAIIQLISKFNSQIFLTHQVGLEYNRNRFEIISNQEKSHNEFLKKLKLIEDNLNSKKTPPFLSEELYNSLNTVFNKVEKEVEQHINSFRKMFDKDEIFENIDRLFADKITEKYPDEKINEIFKIGKDRYNKKIPPGYEDDDKPENKKYGDLIFWKQILDKSKKEEKSIILISDEKKEDWFWKLKNKKTIGPRQELIEELKLFSGKDFHIYSSESFLDFGQTYLKEIVNNEAIKEIEEIKKSNLDSSNKEIEKTLSKNMIKIHLRLSELDKENYESYLEMLTPRESDFIKLFLGLGKFRSMTINEIGETFDLTVSRTNEIMHKAFTNLNNIINEKK